jgi:hypothetical protein
MNLRRSLLASVLLLATMGSNGPSRAGEEAARIAQALIMGLEYDAARSELAAADPAEPAMSLERARLAIYQLDCDGAAAILARPEVQAVPGGDQLADIARGCQRVTAALVEDRDEARGIEVHWQDEHDRALAPLLFDTVAAARDVLSADLGIDWPMPTRIVVVRDLLSLSAMTGLPYESAQTTGTVAVAKWGRVTLLSPRASPHGYPWRDTVAHELSHLAVTRATRDRAPLWLQEGVAKREEVRWREPGPFDARPPPEAVVRRGAERGVTFPLDKLGPSIAMLPNAEDATIAFAEVTSFVHFYVDSAGSEALPNLLRALKEGADPDGALSSVSGADLKAWDSRWHAYLAALPRTPLSPLFGIGSEKEPRGRMKELRDRSRLGQLLLSRGHAEEALKELDRTEFAGSPASPGPWAVAMGDPSARWLRGRALEQAGRWQEGESLVASPSDVESSYGPWWAMRGRWARLRGDEDVAVKSFFEAVAADPLDPEVACEAADPPDGHPGPPGRPLCEAAKAYGPPPFDSD